jgi:hypothetical protein
MTDEPKKATKNAAVEREPMREPLNAYKMRAKPNWESVDANAPETPDRLRIEPSQIPDGLSAQWVTKSVFGQEMASHRSQFESTGWTPVHQDDFDGQFNGRWMPKGKEGEIEVDGLVLMVRPKEMTDKAQALNDMKARQEVAIKERALKGGDMPGIPLDPTHPSALRTNKIGKSLERIEIPEE